MIESGYFPSGAEHDTSAPYNEKKQPPITETCLIRQVLTKEVEVETTDYNICKGEDGCADYEMGEVEWECEYSKQHMTIEELLHELKTYIEHDISLSQTGRQKYRLKWMLNELKGWEREEMTVEKL